MGGGLMPRRTGAGFEGTLRSRAAENGTLEQNRERNRRERDRGRWRSEGKVKDR